MLKADFWMNRQLMQGVQKDGSVLLTATFEYKA